MIVHVILSALPVLEILTAAGALNVTPAYLISRPLGMFSQLISFKRYCLNVFNIYKSSILNLSEETVISPSFFKNKIHTNIGIKSLIKNSYNNWQTEISGTGSRVEFFKLI